MRLILFKGRLISRKPLVNNITKDDKAITEYKELISIFVKSIETACKNKLGKNT